MNIQLKQQLDQNYTSYTKRDYQNIKQWYKKTKQHEYNVQTQLQSKGPPNKTYARLIINKLSYNKLPEITNLHDLNYTIQIFANFYSRQISKFISRPFQTKIQKCTFKKSTFYLNSPQVIYYHMLKYQDLFLFIEFQLITQQYERIRLGYIEINPYQQYMNQNGTFIYKGTPLKKQKQKQNKKLGSCFYQLQISSKILGTLRLLLPELYLVDNQCIVPGSKNKKLGNKQKQLIQLDKYTQIQIDMIQIQKNIQDFQSKVQKVYKTKTNIQNIKVQIQSLQLHFAAHNSYQNIINEFIICKLRTQNGFIYNITSPVKINCIFDTPGFCLIAILSCKVKIQIRSQNIKKDQSKSYDLCWFAFPIHLWKQKQLIQISSMNENIMNKNFQLNKNIKLKCRVYHQNFKQYKKIRDQQEPQFAITKIFEKQQKAKTQWKLLKNNQLPIQSIQQMIVQTKTLLSQKQKIQKLLNKKLWKPKLYPIGNNQIFHPKLPLLDDFTIGNNKIISINIKLDSFMPYYSNLVSRINNYFVPRIWRFQIFMYDKVYESKQVSLGTNLVFRYPSMFSRLDFLAGQSLNSSQFFTLEFEINRNEDLWRLLKSRFIVHSYDGESHLLYGKSMIDMKYILNKNGDNITNRISLQIQQNEGKQIRGSISFDILIKVKNKKDDTFVNDKLIPVQSIANKLNDNVRISQRINRYKYLKNETKISGQDLLKNKDAELELIKKYKQQKIKRYTRNISQQYIDKNQKIIKCCACYPQYFVWQYTNNQNSVNNDFKVVIEDSDHSLLQIDQLTIVSSFNQYKQVCNIIYEKIQNYKNFINNYQFHLKSKQKIKLIFKFLTYRSPNSSRTIQPHNINIKLLRNTLFCQQTKLKILPQPNKINTVFVYYQIMSNILQIQLQNTFATKYIQNFILPIYHNSVTKWQKNKFKISLPGDNIGKKQFLLVVYKNKLRLQVVQVAKIIIYVYQGIKRTIKFGQIFKHSIKLQNLKTKVVRMQSSHPKLTIFRNNIFTVTEYEQNYEFSIFTQQNDDLTVVIMVIDYDTNELFYSYIVKIQLIQNDNIEYLRYNNTQKYSIIKDKVKIRNNMASPTYFYIKSTDSLVELRQTQIYVDAYKEAIIQFHIEQLNQFQSAHIFIYNDLEMLIKVLYLIVLNNQ